jgi:hypothetical protein
MTAAPANDDNEFVGAYGVATETVFSERDYWLERWSQTWCPVAKANALEGQWRASVFVLGRTEAEAEVRRFLRIMNDIESEPFKLRLVE